MKEVVKAAIINYSLYNPVQSHLFLLLNEQQMDILALSAPTFVFFSPLWRTSEINSVKMVIHKETITNMQGSNRFRQFILNIGDIVQVCYVILGLNTC